MACPKCNGMEREPLAPGYWSCSTLISVEHESWVPDDPANPHRGMHPLIETTTARCGEKYQEAPAQGVALPQCACGMFAIGLCVHCGTPACGMHGAVTESGLLCADHAADLATARKARARAEADAAASAAAEEQRRRRETREDERFRRALADFREVRLLADEARADAKYFEQAGDRENAEDLALRIQELVRAVLALPNAASATYSVTGEPRRTRLGKSAVVPDPLGIGTLLSNEWVRAYKRDVPWSTYGRVWPVLCWHASWTREDHPKPIVKSLWFNDAGTIVGGATCVDHALARPAISGYFTAGGHGSSIGSVGPAAGSFGPVPVAQLTAEHLTPVVEESLARPVLMTGVLGRIVKNEKLAKVNLDGMLQ